MPGSTWPKILETLDANRFSADVFLATLKNSRSQERESSETDHVPGLFSSHSSDDGGVCIGSTSDGPCEEPRPSSPAATVQPLPSGHTADTAPVIPSPVATVSPPSGPSPTEPSHQPASPSITAPQPPITTSPATVPPAVSPPYEPSDATMAQLSLPTSVSPLVSPHTAVLPLQSTLPATSPPTHTVGTGTLPALMKITPEINKPTPISTKALLAGSVTLPSESPPYASVTPPIASKAQPTLHGTPPSPSVMEVPKYVLFERICCVGGTECSMVGVRNVGRAWLQCTVTLRDLARNDTKVCIIILVCISYICRLHLYMYIVC